ncbi:MULTISPECIES: DUF7550 family protein [Haloferax]|nr:hypothetical protein [Haloferax mediterranei]AFK18761.2 hypothetical protein HFX_1045 [Haloferax mediterranei ATCC 33500]MDX5988857.1 hypothetical protein [Haloferax mediterranei ATCC 33500]
MSDDHHAGDHDHDDHQSGEDGRVTSPMQDFSMGQVTTGVLVLAVGLAVTFGLPLILA